MTSVPDPTVTEAVSAVLDDPGSASCGCPATGYAYTLAEAWRGLHERSGNDDVCPHVVTPTDDARAAAEQQLFFCSFQNCKACGFARALLAALDREAAVTTERDAAEREHLRAEAERDSLESQRDSWHDAALDLARQVEAVRALCDEADSWGPIHPTHDAFLDAVRAALAPSTPPATELTA